MYKAGCGSNGTFRFDNSAAIVLGAPSVLQKKHLL